MNGNYLPSKSIRTHGYRMVYVPKVSETTPKSLEILVRNLLAMLPDSYSAVLQKKMLNWIDQEVLVIGESDSYMLFVTDDKDKTAVVIAVRPNAPSFAKGKIDNIANRVFDRLYNDYELTVRIGPDITHAYVPHLDRAA